MTCANSRLAPRPSLTLPSAPDALLISDSVLTIPWVAYVSEKVKPSPLMSTPSGMRPLETSSPPQAYSASSDAWMAPRVVASNRAMACAKSSPAW